MQHTADLLCAGSSGGGGAERRKCGRREQCPKRARACFSASASAAAAGGVGERASDSSKALAWLAGRRASHDWSASPHALNSVEVCARRLPPPGRPFCCRIRPRAAPPPFPAGRPSPPPSLRPSAPSAGLLQHGRGRRTRPRFVPTAAKRVDGGLRNQKRCSRLARSGRKLQRLARSSKSVRIRIFQ